MRPHEVFEVCLERLRHCQANQLKIAAIRVDACTEGGPMAVGNRSAEYISDFQVAGRRAILSRFVRGDTAVMRSMRDDGMTLAEIAAEFHISESYVSLLLRGKRIGGGRRTADQRIPHCSKATRQKMAGILVLHCIEGRQPEEVCETLRIGLGVFYFWLEEVRRICGREFAVCGLFPPWSYFHEPIWLMIERRKERRLSR